MSTVIICHTDQNVVGDLRTVLDEVPDLVISHVVSTTIELHRAVAKGAPDLVLIGDQTGPDSADDVCRSFLAVHPETAVIQVLTHRSPQAALRAMEAGARGVVSQPFAFEDVSERIGRALEYADTMRTVIAGTVAQRRRRGRLICVAGAKGGVGTTTLAVHMAADFLRVHPQSRVCVVDADVEKGDVAAVLDIRQSVSIADIAKVYSDLSANTVGDAVIQHESGIHVMLAPVDVRESDYITPEAIHAILDLLRMEFPLVIVDAGGHVSPSQAAIAQMADEMVVVTSPDALVMRAFRKRAAAWESLGVRDEAELKVVVNKVDKRSIFPASAVAKLTVAKVVDVMLPFMPRALEVASNDRDPRALTEVSWWRLISSLRHEVGADESFPTSVDSQTRRIDLPEEQPMRTGRQVMTLLRDLGWRFRDERGAATLEDLGMLPIMLLVVLAGWQILVVGVSDVMLGRAASAASREYAVTGSLALATDTARAGVPAPFNDVTVSGDSTINVKLRVPGSLTGVWGVMDVVETSKNVVEESR